ncbi:transposase [Bradyrhizobium sp. 145]|uniref:transposase n=1 Tax=Bradyrhizobium sp. 145 TaxID=2782621 RepID=UPI0032119F5B
MILAHRELLTVAKSELTVGRLKIERLKLMLAKARREQFGQSSEHGRLLVEQLELAIEDLEETQAEQEATADMAAHGSRQAEACAQFAAASTSSAR